MKISVKAPGVLKLLGEHAVVYDYLAVAVAVDRYAAVEVDIGYAPDAVVFLEDLGKTFRFTHADLLALYEKYKEIGFGSKESIKRFKERSGIEPEALPYAVILARLSHQYGINVGGLRVHLTSDIPMGKGWASSAACFTAFSLAIVHADNSKLEDADQLDVAIDGERINHGKPGAGRIDVSTSYYGGVVSVKKENGELRARREDVGIMPEIIAIDTGPEKSTEETTGIIAKEVDDNPTFAKPRLAGIGEFSERGLAALKDGNFEELGKCMNSCQRLLAELGVSSYGLFVATHTALEAGAWGAKLSGGGGGGVAIAIAPDINKLIAALKASRFDVSLVGISQIGARAHDAKSVMRSV